MKGIKIDEAKVSDIDTLWKWGEENWELWGDEVGKWFSKESLRRWIEDPEDDILLVARNGKQLVGMCMTSVMRDWAFCLGLFVEQKVRNQGIGKLLIDETLKRLLQKGIRNLILLVDTKNEKAKKFYEREGFATGYSFYFMSKDIPKL